MIFQLDFIAVLFPPVVAVVRAALGSVALWTASVRDARSLVDLALTCRLRARFRHGLEDLRESYRRITQKLTGNPDL